MKLRTTINLKAKEEKQIDYNSSIFSVGSCFVENIGGKLSYYKFKAYNNPFGILFNPVAIANLIERAIEFRAYDDNEVFLFNEQWHCSAAHSELNSSSKEIILNRLNEQLLTTKNFLGEASHIIITLGTAWVYREIKTNKIVANCHKRPQSEFNKELLSVNQIVDNLSRLQKAVKCVNDNVQIIYTVSPVRHLKDGFVENNLSKSLLNSAINTVIADTTQSYFPSYEIMMDDLRDYRFYDRDMIHPNQLAIDYIWEKFRDVWIATDAHGTMEDVEKVQKALQHKPFNPNSDGHLKFTQNTLSLINHLNSQFPHIVF